MTTFFTVLGVCTFTAGIMRIIEALDAPEKDRRKRA